MPTTVRLSTELEARLSNLSTKTGRTKAFYLREIISRGMDEVEDYYLAAEVAARVRTGKEGIHSAAEVKRALALDD
ncbi:MAG TPA: CopG family transcriptional regulator [Rhizobiaceae bacterium]|nr:CopG family transcriptional regulator [Rhizobiaceae bacterium]